MSLRRGTRKREKHSTAHYKAAATRILGPRRSMNDRLRKGGRWRKHAMARRDRLDAADEIRSQRDEVGL